jgi:hypothetical protein
VTILELLGSKLILMSMYQGAEREAHRGWFVFLPNRRQEHDMSMEHTLRMVNR